MSFYSRLPWVAMPLGPVSDFDEEWKKLAVCMDAIYSMTGCETISASSFMTSVYRICISTMTSLCHAEELYRTLEKYFITHIQEKREKIEETDSSAFLSTYADEWALYSLGTQLSKDLFSYLEQYWIRRQICPDPFWESDSAMLFDDMNILEETDVCYYEPLCMKIWKEHLFLKFGNRITLGILQLLQQERAGESIKHSLISQIVSSCVLMNEDQKGNGSVYLDFIESPYLEATHSFYMKESIIFIEENGAINYLRKALERIEEEQTRTLRYLQPGSKEQAENIINQVLIQSHKEKMIKEFVPCLHANKIDDLHRMFLLLQRIEGGFHPMDDCLLHYIEKHGHDFLEAATKDAMDSKKEKNRTTFEVLYTEALLDIYLKFKELISNAFQNHPSFVAIMEHGVRNIVKNNESICQGKYHPAQLLAQYCDYVLRKNSTVKLEDAELEKRLEYCAELFKFIDDKDIFQKQYSIHLASRLIDDNSTGEEHEQLFIRGLQATSGLDYTSKLQRMFQDMKVGQSLSTQCREYWEKEAFRAPLDFTALVLTSGSWPISNPSSQSCFLPESFTLCINQFESFYDSIHSGRKLTWLHHCSKGELYAHYPQKTYQITMPTHMMIVLLLFNSNSILKFTQIQAETNLSDSELKRALKILVVQRLLVSDLKTLSKDTKFKMNMKFKEKRLKLKLGSKAPVEKVVRPNSSSSSIANGRKLLLQSAIVRIMKMRKEAAHNDLVQEVFQQVSSRFVPEVQQIKRVIETLIEKEYIDRVKGENKYRYLA